MARAHRSHNISVSSGAWAKWGELTEAFDCKYRSELMEKIGRGEIELKEQSGLASPTYHVKIGSRNISTLVRLESIYRASNPLLRSMTASIYRYIRQLGLCDRDDFEQSVGVMKDCLIDTAKIIEVINHLKPEYTPKSMTTLMNWISYCILFEKCDAEPEHRHSARLLSDSQIEEILFKIGFAFFRMRKLYPKEYRLLEARFVFQKNYSVIVDYLNSAYGDEYSSDNILQASVAARSVFRALLHSLEDSDEFADYQSDGIQESVIDAVFPRPQKIERYCDLVSRDRVTIQEHQEICEILKEASNDLALDFWINELDHVAGHYLGVISRRSKKDDRDAVLRREILPHRSFPAYSEKEKTALENLEKDVDKAVSTLRAKITRQYSLLENVGEFDDFLLGEIRQISELDIYSLFRKTCEMEVASYG